MRRWSTRRRPPLVGRDEPLGVLRTALRRARAGHAQRGHRLRRDRRRQDPAGPRAHRPGAGPRARRRLRADGRRAAAVRRADPGAAPPAGPGCCRQLDGSRSWPGWSPAPPRPGRPAPPASPARPQLRLFQSVLGLLDRLGAAASRPARRRGPALGRPVDAGPAPRSWPRTSRDERVVLLLTYRDRRGRPRRRRSPRWLAELARLDAHRARGPGPAGPRRRPRLVAALAGPRRRPGVARDTLARSAGNPLFVEQLVLAGRAGTGRCPPPCTSCSSARVATLPEETRAVLRRGRRDRPSRAGAAARRHSRTPSSTSRTTCGRPSTAHVAEVRTRRHHRVPAPGVPRGRVRRAAAGRTTASAPGRRRGARPAEGRTGGARGGRRDRPALAPGRRPPRALDAVVAAGHAYERLYAFADAQASYSRAIDLLHAVPNELDAVDLRTRAGECASLVRDTPAAIRPDRRGRWPAPRRPAGPGGAAQRLGSFHFLAGDGPAAESAFREALGLLPPEETSALAARLHAGLALLAAAWSRLDEARQPAPRRCEISREIGARREEGLALNAPALVAAARGDLESGERLLRQSLAIAREVGQPRRPRRRPTSTSPTCSALGGRIDAVVELWRGRDRGAQPLRAGPPERQPAAVQHRRRAAQVRSGRRGRGADRRGAGAAPARDHGGAGAARRRPLAA